MEFLRDAVRQFSIVDNDLAEDDEDEEDEYNDEPAEAFRISNRGTVIRLDPWVDAHARDPAAKVSSKHVQDLLMLTIFRTSGIICRIISSPA